MKDPNTITLKDVIIAANSFLNKFHPSYKIPVPIEDIVEIDLKIKLVLIQGLIKDFGVNAFISQDFNSIIIDEGMFSRQPERIRFTIAEEIGHLYLHKDWYSQNGPGGMEEYLKFQDKIDAGLYSYIERQAKTFASMILIPSPIIDNVWKEFSKKNNLSIPCSVYDLPDLFPQIAHQFEVSTDCLLVRLSSLKYIEVPIGFWSKVKN